ncbi:MAG: SDR family oxidoreductase [Candidatus Altiarchaeota archaeon]|nr:SDR family oxidoreductase [Candidatus Altiarchaeota archaeon]
MGLKGKCAVVTGAAKGIGEGIARRLAMEGANVVLSDIDLEGCRKAAEKIRKESGVKAIANKCDVSVAGEVKDMVKEALDEFRRIDVLVNNAGIYPFKPFLELTEADWDKVLSTNLKSAFMCSREAAKAMADGGRIINISSVAARIGYAGLAHYCASKAGMEGLTRAMALELAPRKIKVNAVAPGAIDTPGAGMDEATRRETLALIPLGRIGLPADVAGCAAFLASKDADYITGQVLVVDGGWTVQ